MNCELSTYFVILYHIIYVIKCIFKIAFSGLCEIES